MSSYYYYYYYYYYYVQEKIKQVLYENSKLCLLRSSKSTHAVQSTSLTNITNVVECQMTLCELTSTTNVTVSSKDPIGHSVERWPTLRSAGPQLAI